jgi:hypothetical protein
MRIMWVQRDPTARRAAVGNVIVKNLPPSIDAKTINDLFGAFGTVQSVRLSTDAQGKGRGYGFVQVRVRSWPVLGVTAATAEPRRKAATFNAFHVPLLTHTHTHTHTQHARTLCFPV